MRTVEIVDELIERFKGWGTDGPHGVLRYLNQAHEILLACESLRNIVYDSSTGVLPVLHTEHGRHDYFVDTNIWRVGGIVLPLNRGSHLNDYGMRGQSGRRERTVNVGGVEYTYVNGVTTADWQSSAVPARAL